MLRGLRQFENNLKDVEQKFRGEVLKKALLEAVQPLIRQAAANAPVGITGKLSRSMTAQAMAYAGPNEAIVRVGPGRPEGSHGILLEYGTIHMTARPFLALAYEATFQDVLDLLENDVINQVENAVIVTEGENAI